VVRYARVMTSVVRREKVETKPMIEERESVSPCEMARGCGEVLSTGQVSKFRTLRLGPAITRTFKVPDIAT